MAITWEHETMGRGRLTVSLGGAAAHQSSSLLLLKGETEALDAREPSWPVVSRLSVAGPLVLAHGGRVPQEPASTSC